MYTSETKFYKIRALPLHMKPDDIFILFPLFLMPVKPIKFILQPNGS